MGGVVDTWDLVSQLVPPSPESFRSQDIALGAISSLPVLFLLLFTTSFLITDLRACLPDRLQSLRAALLFSSMMLPTVPAAFVTNLLGNMLFVGYFRVGERVQPGFERTWFRRLHETLAVIGIATSTGFLALILGLTLSTAMTAKARARWLMQYRSIASLWLIAFGVLLAGVDITLALVAESFAVVLARRVISSASRVMMTIALVGSYYPGSSSVRHGVQLPMDPPKRSQERVRDPTRPVRPSISGPVSGSFQRMSHAATRSFHTSPRARARENQSPEGKGKDKEATPKKDRVTLSSDLQRGPKLSIAPSTFDHSDLASLAGDVRDREELIQRSIAMKEELAGGHDPFLSPEEQRERYLQVKQGMGSIYRPSLIPVKEIITPVKEYDDNPLKRSEWPLASDLNSRKGLASWNALSGEESQTTGQNHRVGQVSAHRTGDHLHPTPQRSNSSKRKPVPDLESVADKSIAGHLSFISMSDTPESEIAPSLAPPSPASTAEEDRPGPSRRQHRRRDTDPAAAVIPRSPDGSSLYSQSTEQADDRTLFFRAPLRSPSTVSPTKSSNYSPHVSILPPSRTSMTEGWNEDQTGMAMALSSLARVRRDTGVDLARTLEPQSASTARSDSSRISGAVGEPDAIDRSSINTWTSDDLTPRASERGWWGSER